MADEPIPAVWKRPFINKWKTCYTVSLVIILAMSAVTISVFSYRLDKVGYFEEHSGFHYEEPLKGGWLVAFYIHKSCMHIWTFAALIHTWYTITFSTGTDPGKNMGPGGKLRTIHMITGSIIITVIPLGIVSGLALLYNGQERYANFTKYALGVTAAVVTLMYVLFMIARFAPEVLMRKIVGRSIHHGVVGVVFNVVPFAFVLQFWIYSLGVLAANKYDFFFWIFAMIMCGVVAVSMSLLFMLVMFYYPKTDEVDLTTYRAASLIKFAKFLVRRLKHWFHCCFKPKHSAVKLSSV